MDCINNVLLELDKLIKQRSKIVDKFKKLSTKNIKKHTIRDAYNGNNIKSLWLQIEAIDYIVSVVVHSIKPQNDFQEKIIKKLLDSINKI